MTAAEAEGTVRFGLDGNESEIDLNAEHAQALRAGGRERRPARSGRRASADGLNTTEVCEWAKAQGMDFEDRGRVPAELVVKSKAATAQQNPGHPGRPGYAVSRTCLLSMLRGTPYIAEVQPVTRSSLSMLAVRSLNEPSHDVAQCHVRKAACFSTIW